MRSVRHVLQRAGMARTLICGGKRNHKFLGAASGLVQSPGDAIPLSHHASRLLAGSAISSGSATVLDGQQAPAKAGPLFQYERRLESGELMAGDTNQEKALKALQTLYDDLVENAVAMELDNDATQNTNRQQSWFWTNFLSSGRDRHCSSVKGLYLYGGVGTGKTMLMDLFYEELSKKWKKRRTHFHDFMLNVHSRLQKQKGMSDPLQAVSEEISNESKLLCLDEFMVTDVADALILNRLFRHLFAKGIVLVTTSNRGPDQLYEGGLQRDLFLPFIALLKARCIVHEIGSGVDYRRLNTNEEGFFFYGKGACTLLKDKFRLITDGNLAKPSVVEVVMGRKLQVPFAANGCAYFQYHELCEMPLGAADYIGLFKSFHTLALQGIPVFGSHNRLGAYRFVTMIDVMYESRARLLCSAEDELPALFKRCVTVADAPTPRDSRAIRNDDADLCVDNELGFAKERTISRLTEMISRPYLEEHAARVAQKDQRYETDK